jgi:hypothetical protein
MVISKIVIFDEGGNSFFTEGINWMNPSTIVAIRPIRSERLFSWKKMERAGVVFHEFIGAVRPNLSPNLS